MLWHGRRLAARLVAVTGRNTAAVGAERPRGGSAARCRDCTAGRRLKRNRRQLVAYVLSTILDDFVHLRQDEHFKVQLGTMSYWLDGVLHELPAGGKITLPKGKDHNHFNNSDEPLAVVQTVEPALDSEQLLRTLIGLAIDGKLANGSLNFFQSMVLATGRSSRAGLRR